jgi:hypothetical protein
MDLSDVGGNMMHGAHIASGLHVRAIVARHERPPRNGEAN